MDYRSLGSQLNRDYRRYLERAFAFPDAARFLLILSPLVTITILIVSAAIVVALGIYPPGAVDASVLEFLRITNEQSLGEFYELALLLFTSAALLSISRRTYDAVFSVVAVGYLWVAIDGFLSIHEYLGRTLAAMVPGLDTDIGELVAFVPFGVFLVVVSLRQSVANDVALQNAIMVALIWILGLLAVGVDFLHSLVPTDLAFRPDRILGLIEDGGEMLVIAVAGAYAAYLLWWYSGPQARTLDGPKANQGRPSAHDAVQTAAQRRP